MMLLDDLKSILSTPIEPLLENNDKYRLASILVVIYGDEPIIVMTRKTQRDEIPCW